MQSHCVSVQSKLELVLKRILGHAVRVVAASRTDAGVHARGQHVSFATANPIPLDALLRAMNHHLPLDIRVRRCRAVADDFSARYHARSKHYAYVIINAAEVDPLIADLGWFIKRPLCHEAMHEAAQLIVGTRCFRSLQASRDVRQDTVTTMYRTRVWRSGTVLSFEVVGRNFLYHMVRNLAGSLLKVGLEEWRVDEFGKRLLGGDRKGMGVTAPAHGLHLVNVNYGDLSESWDCEGEQLVHWLAAAGKIR